VIVGSFRRFRSYFFWRAICRERKRAIIAPELLSEPEAEDFEISLFEIDYPQKFVTLQHQHILGTIMSLRY
jgi:RNA-binding protein YlmH